MPGERDIQIIKDSFFGHQRFSNQLFFRRTSVIANSSCKTLCIHCFFNRCHGTDTSGSQQVMSTAVSISTFHKRFLCRLYFLGQTRQCIVLAEQPDNRISFPIFCHKCGRHIRNFFHLKSQFFQILFLNPGRLNLLMCGFRIFPDFHCHVF